MRASRHLLRLAFVLLLPCHAVGVAAQVAASTDPVPTRDAAVARAVAEAAATSPDPAAQSDAVNPRPRAFDALDSLPRRCTALEASAKLALLATCIRTQHCSPTPIPVAAQSPLTSCYLIKTRANG